MAGPQERRKSRPRKQVQAGQNCLTETMRQLKMIADTKGENVGSIVTLDSPRCLRGARLGKVETGAVVFLFTEQRHILGHQVSQADLGIQAHYRAGG